MHHARCTIPRSADIPFHVGVVSEQFAVWGKGEVVRITHTTRNQFPFVCIFVGAHDDGGRRVHSVRMPPRIPDARQQNVFGNVLERRAWRKIGRYFSVVTNHHIEFVIGSQSNSVRAMFTCRAVFC